MLDHGASAPPPPVRLGPCSDPLLSRPIPPVRDDSLTYWSITVITYRLRNALVRVMPCVWRRRGSCTGAGAPGRDRGLRRAAGRRPARPGREPGRCRRGDRPGADAPFGMLQWSPDTVSRPEGGGYAYGDSAISGFSLTHLSGPGCRAAGDIPVLPTVGAVDVSATDSFSHAAEAASAGYYRVALDNGVTVQLTATTRTGLARFSFPATARAHLIQK